MKKIIITGATSMIGAALTEAAIREGTEVYAIIRPDTARGNRLPDSPLIHPVHVALDGLRGFDGLPADCDVLYHLAWAGTPKGERDDPRIQERNIGYTLDAVELARRAGCRRFVGAGSQAEYGPVRGRIDSGTAIRPATAYGIAKYAAGMLSRAMCEKSDMEHVWARIFSVYGPHDNEGTMLNYAISCFRRGETASFSASTQPWNYLYESDAGEMLYRMGSRSAPPGMYFVASPHSRKLREYIDILMSAYGEDARAVFAGEGMSQSCGLDVDMGDTFERISYIPQVEFQEGIARMIHHRR